MKNISYIGLGTNLGNRNKNLETALSEIDGFAKILKKSSVHETEPMGYRKQGKFLNMVIAVETDLEANELMIKLLETEHKMGRIREIKNGPRIIDLDILIYNDENIDRPELKIPHPRMHARDFVMQPLTEIAPQYGSKKN